MVTQKYLSLPHIRFSFKNIRKGIFIYDPFGNVIKVKIMELRDIKELLIALLKKRKNETPLTKIKVSKNKKRSLLKRVKIEKLNQELPLKRRRIYLAVGQISTFLDRINQRLYKYYNS